MKALYFTSVIFLAFLLHKTECKVLTSHVCEYYNPECGYNCPRLQKCAVHQGKISHCFALYSDTPNGVKVLRKGCWLQNLLFCPLDFKCSTKPITNKHGLQFCCCTGDKCNAKID
ncbi:activin receptor type-2A-like [Actinia tenebrosa]|uniref:Activin receptor type-2A-like n=1 Tax=Actinia tenebrosa TaxID=6105 RepID=A0A6P8IRF3_ACTTE|nr:activin receptor type-2A-like [Actinia tenebrosa]